MTMDNYRELIKLLIQCERDLKGVKVIKEFAPSCSINEIAFYLYKHGVKVKVVDADEASKGA